MKRKISEGHGRRQKDLYDFAGVELFDFPERQRYVSSIIRDQLDGRPGYIVGTIDAIEDDEDKAISILITMGYSENSKTMERVKVIFGKNCARRLRLRNFEFVSQNEIFISLRDCTLLGGSSSNVPVTTLKFSDRVLVKMLSPKTQIVVDLWNSTLVQQSANTDVEGLQVPPDRSPVLVPHTSPSCPPPKLSKKERKLLRAKAYFENKEASSCQPPQQRGPPIETKSKSNVTGASTSHSHGPASRSSVSSKKVQLASNIPKDPNKEASSCPPPQQRGPSIENKSKSNITAASTSHYHGPASRSSVSSTRAQLSSNIPKDPLRMQAGRQWETMTITPLTKVTQKNHLYNVVAIALSGSEIVQNASGDFNCTLQLVDPSNRMLSDNSHLMSYSVKANCFSKVSRHWLPKVKAGDIVVLKDAKGGGYNGNPNLVGYYDKLRWALYRSDGRLHHGELPSDVPKDIVTDRGNRHNPFFNSVDPKLLEYCSELREWWNAIELERKKALGQTHQIGNLVTPPPERSARPHLLIKDANPNLVSNGYFNCTAEVIHKHRGDACYDIYITDYTSNSSCPNYETNWCPRGLSNSILKVELWDRSAEYGPNMEIGDIYSFRNIRIRLANNGTYEAKIQEPKFAKLDPEDATPPLTLKSMLERKAKWAAKHKTDEPLDKLDYTTIEDVRMWNRFNCVVEVLFVQYTDSSSSVKVYVTDYTENDMLADIDLKHAKLDHLPKRVFKMILRDSQAEKGKKLEPGDVCVFLKVIMKLINRENVGDLGGEQRLIKRLNGGLESHQKLMEGLQKRKRSFLAKQAIAADTDSARSIEPSLTGIPAGRAESSAPESSRSFENPVVCTSIEELRNHAESEVLFEIPARITLAHPRKLQDFIHRWCKKCGNAISAKYQACISCNDTDHEFVGFRYHFNLWIEEDADDRHDELPIVVGDDALFLQEMPRVDLGRNREAFDVFQRWFETFAGNILQYQEDHFEGKETELKTPLLCFNGCRYEENGKKKFHLYSYSHLGT
ncbi:hypothetical protein GYMLUDRAFT_255006 [Collybiopsis luxurians FD-317 M1]|nr:hypothetical protein GYMLUDRAFT_255006 [Collybiopsis luxurians FD-317 M1]